MSSTRKLGLMVLAIGAVMLGGCQDAKEQTEKQVNAFHLEKHMPPSEPMNHAVVVGDPALDLRQWDPSSAYYVNDAVIAGPTYAPLQVAAMDYWLNAPAEQALFIMDLFYIPVGVFIEYPWSDELYKSFTAKPSYTLMPPLPNGPEPAPVAFY
jgi:hypothetical protein